MVLEIKMLGWVDRTYYVREWMYGEEWKGDWTGGRLGWSVFEGSEQRLWFSLVQFFSLFMISDFSSVLQFERTLCVCGISHRNFIKAKTCANPPCSYWDAKNYFRNHCHCSSVTVAVVTEIIVTDITAFESLE